MNAESTSKREDGDGSTTFLIFKEIPIRVRRATRAWWDRLGKERQRAVAKGRDEGKGSYTVERIIVWALSLSNDDFDRIQEEGRPLLAQLREEMSPEHIAAHKPPLFHQRTASVFAGRSAPGPGEPSVVKGYPGRRNTRKNGSEGEDSGTILSGRPNRRS